MLFLTKAIERNYFTFLTIRYGDILSIKVDRDTKASITNIFSVA